MTDASSEDLLGFALQAHEPEEHQRIEELVSQEPRLKEELQTLQARIEPLEDLNPAGLPPAGLARRTCELIAKRVSVDGNPNRPETSHSNSKTTGSLDTRMTRGSGQGFRRTALSDFCVVVAIFVALAGIALPALNSNRQAGQLLACQDNLRTVGMGLLHYADNHGGKHMPLPAEGNLSFAGVYAPQLLEQGFVENPNAFQCAGIGKTKNQSIPSLQQLRQAEPTLLRTYQKRAGGDFAYSIGQWRDGRYHPGVNLNRGDFILLADTPNTTLAGRASSNHGGQGQNVFFEDGHIDFLSQPEINGDAIYENDWGGIAPGAHQGDIVLAPSVTGIGQPASE